MKKVLSLLMLILVLSATNAFAYRKGSHPSQDTGTYGHDANGHLTRNDNMMNDSDGDGVNNYNDSSDSNPYKF